MNYSAKKTKQISRLIELLKGNLRTIHFNGVDISVSITATSLEVLIDSELTFTAHIKFVTEWCFSSALHYSLRSCSRGSNNARPRLRHHCNSIFSLTSAIHLHPFQSAVNTAAHLIVKRRNYDHSTDSLRD